MKFKLIKKINPPLLSSPNLGEVGWGCWLISLVLKEGRKRQIRRVAELLGYRVDKLKRVRIGKLYLGDLPPGQYRDVKTNEII